MRQQPQIISPTSKSFDNFLRDYSQNFSRLLGGPVFQLLRRSHLTDDALEHASQRIIAISLFCWLPLLALSVLEGNALGQRVVVPFLLDLKVYTRFLLAIPLLIAAELVMHWRCVCW